MWSVVVLKDHKHSICVWEDTVKPAQVFHEVLTQVDVSLYWAGHEYPVEPVEENLGWWCTLGYMEKFDQE